MTRPVRGFMTKHGHFFATKAEAATHEATTDFHDALNAHMLGAGLSGTVQEFVVDKVREFVLINKDAVRAYITLMKSIPEVNTTDIRSVLLQPATGPVDILGHMDPTDLLYPDTDPEPMEAAEIDEDFISAFEHSVGQDDSGRTETGGNEMD